MAVIECHRIDACPGVARGLAWQVSFAAEGEVIVVNHREGQQS